MSADRRFPRVGLILGLGVILASATAAVPGMAAVGGEQTSGAAIAGVWVLAHPVPLLHTAEGRTPPLKPGALTVYRRNLALSRKQDFGYDSARRRCSSPGMPRIMTVGWPIEIVVRPQQVMMLFTWNHLYRQIPISKDAPEPLYPTAIGATTAHWEGDALVVTTTGRDDKTLLDDAIPSSGSLQIVERIRRRGPLLEDRMTISDPGTFTRPWRTVLTYRRLARAPDVEDVCLDRMAGGHPAIN